METIKTNAPLLGRYVRMLPLLIIGNTIIAVLLALSGMSGGFLRTWIFCQIFGCSIGSSCLVISHALKPRRPWIVILLGSALGIVIAKVIVALFGMPGIGGYILGDREAGLRLTGLALIFTIAFAYFFRSREQLNELEDARKEAELRRTHEENAALVAHLQMLQAQIEPHFLFNTLANLHSLIGTDPVRARTLLERLNDYLRASLDHSRSDSRTLGDECQLLRAYLDIQSMRMGDRLTWTLEVSEGLRALALPPMLLQPLVENAIVHGIEPKVGPGRIEIGATLAKGVLHLSVCDDGVGFSDDKLDHGIGLANVRERLQALYGAEAGIQILSNGAEHQTGVIAELWMPVPLAP